MVCFFFLFTRIDCSSAQPFDQVQVELCARGDFEVFDVAADKEHKFGCGKRGRTEDEKVGSAQGTFDEHVEKGEEAAQEAVAIGQGTAGNEGRRE